MRPWRSSPLMRASYRAESVLHVGALVLILLALPLTIVLGAGTYSARIQQADRIAATIHPTQATLDADANPRDLVYGVMTVRAHWNYLGKQHVNDVIVDAKARAGDHISIWINDVGDQTAKPPTHAQALPDAIAVGVGVFGLIAAFVLALWHLLGWWLDARRCSEWSKEWAALENVPKWNHP